MYEEDGTLIRNNEGREAGKYHSCWLAKRFQTTRVPWKMMR
jgi:hypothetical protein